MSASHVTSATNVAVDFTRHVCLPFLKFDNTLFDAVVDEKLANTHNWRHLSKPVNPALALIFLGTVPPTRQELREYVLIASQRTQNLRTRARL